MCGVALIAMQATYNGSSTIPYDDDPRNTSHTTKLYLNTTHADRHPLGIRLVHPRNLTVSITLVPCTVVLDMAHLRSGCPLQARTTTTVYAPRKIQSQRMHEGHHQRSDRLLQLQPFPSIALIHIRPVVDMGHWNKDKCFHTLPIHSLPVPAFMLMYRRLSLYRQVTVAITQRKRQKIATIATSFSLDQSSSLHSESNMNVYIQNLQINSKAGMPTFFLTFHSLMIFTCFTRYRWSIFSICSPAIRCSYFHNPTPL